MRGTTEVFSDAAMVRKDVMFIIIVIIRIRIRIRIRISMLSRLVFRHTEHGLIPFAGNSDMPVQVKQIYCPGARSASCKYKSVG